MLYVFQARVLPPLICPYPKRLSSSNNKTLKSFINFNNRKLMRKYNLEKTEIRDWVFH